MSKSLSEVVGDCESKVRGFFRMAGTLTLFLLILFAAWQTVSPVISKVFGVIYPWFMDIKVALFVAATIPVAVAMMWYGERSVSRGP